MVSKSNFLVVPKTGAKYTVNKELDQVKSVKTKSNKIDALRTLSFEFKSVKA